MLRFHPDNRFCEGHNCRPALQPNQGSQYSLLDNVTLLFNISSWPLLISNICHSSSIGWLGKRIFELRRFGYITKRTTSYVLLPFLKTKTMLRTYSLGTDSSLLKLVHCVFLYFCIFYFFSALSVLLFCLSTFLQQ